MDFRGPRLLVIAVVCAFSGVQTPAQQDPNRGAESLNAARQLRRGGDPQGALQNLQSLLASFGADAGKPELHAAVLREIGEIYLDRNAPKEAARYLERSVAQDPAVAAAHYELGLAYREMGENRNAAAALQSAIDKGFRNAAASFHLIAACFDSRQFTKGLDLSEQLISAAPKSPDLLMRLGRLLFQHLYYEQAAKAFQAAVQLEPQAFESRFYLALTRHLLGQDSETIALLEPLSAAKPNAELLTLLGSSQAQLGNLDAAERILRDALAREPRNPHAYLNLALIELDRDRLDAADVLLGRLRALDTGQSPKVFFAVRRNSCAQVLDAARPDAAGSAGADRERFEYLNQLAVQMQAGYHYAAAVQLIRLALRHGSVTARALNTAGLSCFNLDPQSTAAVALLEKAVAADASMGEAWHLLGRAYGRQRRSREAVTALEKAVTLKPSAAWYTNLGRAYVAQASESPDSAAKAIECFEKAIQLEPDHAMAHYEIGRLYAQMQRWEEAKPHLMRAIDIEPDFYEAYYSLGQVCVRAGNQDQGQKFLALFEQKRQAVKKQSVLSSGFLSEGRE
jgi:tetratricopeptide (TPR) repeat protein